MMMETYVGGNNIMNVTGNLSEFIGGNVESHTEKERISISKGEVLSQSTGKFEQHSQKEVENNSAEKSKTF